MMPASALSPLLSRADELALGDYIAVQNHLLDTVVMRVNSLEEIGDDVIINDRLTTSVSNQVVRLGKTFTVVTG
jgi:hypothetical protein